MMMMMMMIVVCILVQLAAPAEGALGATASIVSIAPSVGSVAGGTIMTIRGSGFSRQGQSGSTTVYFGTDECDVIEYYTTDTQIVCVTPPGATNLAVAVTVQLISVSKTAFAICQTSCKYTYVNWRTPVMRKLPVSAVAGELMPVAGTLYGLEVSQFDIKLGDYRCVADEADNANPMTTWSDGTAWCRVGSQPAGYYTVKTSVTDTNGRGGFGAAQTMFHLWRGVDSGSVYNTAILPVIYNLSYAATGANGGALLRIDGNGFSLRSSDLSIVAGNAPCDIVSSSLTRITCIPRAVVPVNTTTTNGTVVHPVATTAAVPFPGTAGMIAQRYDGAVSSNMNGLWRMKTYPNSPSRVTLGVRGLIVQNGTTVEDMGDYYGQRITGFFVPPVTGTYQFLLAGDDYASFSFSTDASPSNMRVVASMPSYSKHYWFHPEQTSAAMNLQADVPYYFQLEYVEWSGQDWVKVAARLRETPTMQFAPAVHKFSSLPDFQGITMSTTVARETQVIRITGVASGKFQIAAGTKVTQQLTWPITASNMASAVASIITCGYASVSRTNVMRGTTIIGYDWAVTIPCPAAIPQTLFTVQNVALVAASNSTIAFSVQRTVNPSAPLSGTYRLGYGGQWTPAIAITANTDTVTNALQALPGLTQVVVTYDGNAQDYLTINVEVQMPSGYIAPISLDASSMSGNQLTTKMFKYVNGSNDLFMDPIPATFLRAPSPVSTIDLKVNGIRAACGEHDSPASLTRASPCAFRRDMTLTPQVTAIAPTTVAVGDTVTISGSGFAPTIADNSVMLGTAPCNIISASSSQIRCNVDHGTAGTHLTPTVIVKSGAGRATVATGVTVTLTGSLAIPTVTLQGSKEGGIIIHLNGTGIGADSVSVGSAPCTAVQWAFNWIACQVPSCVSALSSAQCAGSNATAQVRFMGQPVTGLQFMYQEALTPVVDSVSPSQISDAVSTLITFTGHSLCAPDAPKCGLTVTIGNRPCVVRTASATSFTCFLVRVSSSTKVAINDTTHPVVSVATHGNARLGSQVAINHGFSIVSVLPRQGSLMGGMNVTMIGVGLQQAVASSVQIVLAHSEMDPIPCYVVSTSHTQLVCTLATFTHCANMSLVHLQVGLIVNRITAACHDHAHNCTIDLATASTPVVTRVQLLPNNKLQVFGTGFSTNSMVLLGNTPCPTDPSNVTAMVCTIPPHAAETVPVFVHVPGKGCSATSATYTWVLTISSVSHTTGSTAGGDYVIITGTGFSANVSRLSVMFGTGAATILSATPTKLTVRSAALAAATKLAAPTSVAVTVTLAPGADIVQASSGLHGLHSTMNGLGLPQTSAVPITVTAAQRYNYDATLTYTPTLTSLAPRTGSKGTSITINGNGFGATVNGSQVLINNVACDVVTWTAIKIVCRLGASPAGVVPVQIYISGKGLASCGTVCSSTTFTPKMAIDSVVGPTGGIGGGSLLTVNGYGFGPTSVFEVCGLACTPVSVSYTKAQCLTPAWVSQSSYTMFTGESLPTKLSGIIFAVGCCPSYTNGAVDSDLTTTSSFSNGLIGIGLRMNYLYVSYLKYVRFFPAYGRSTQLRGGRIEASMDGITYVQLLKIDSPHEGWNTLDMPGGERFFRFFRYMAPSGQPSPFAELEFWGYTVLANDFGGRCPVRVNATATTGAAFVTAKTAFNYTLAATPQLYSVHPNNGSSLGGTLLTISGRNFHNVAANVSVMIDGVSPCVVQSATSTVIRCITSQRKAIAPGPSFAITMPTAAGRVLLNSTVLPFRYLDRWSDPDTWDAQEPPVTDDFVVIPAGQTVLLDVTPPRLLLLLVQGMLVFDRTDLQLEATYIWVQGGRMEIGTHDEPFLNHATITLHGDRHDTIEIPELGAKVLAVSDRVISEHTGMMPMQDPSNPTGVLEIHGRPRVRVWTRLSETVHAGTNVLHVEEDVDYAPGEHLVLSPSYDRDTAEEVVVAKLLNPRTIVLQDPVQFTHRVLRYQVPQGTGPKHEGQTVFMTCEVGLLTRNVVIQGDDKSDPQLFGAHTKAVHGGVYRVENAEFRRCGQSFILGRYCIHYHMANAQETSYVRANSVHHSFQRACTIHGTHYLRVTDNVAYDITGHAFFVEDGAEHENTLEGNLGVYISPSAALLRSDEKPAVFWTSTPRNFWRHNVATGSTHFGFWFELPTNPGGPSFTTDICPAGDFVGEFFNNTAHGNGQHGMRVYPQYFPHTNPCDFNTPPAPAYFYNTTAYWNGGNGLFVRNSGDIHFVGYRLLENDDDEIFWEEMHHADPVGQPHIIDALLVSTTEPHARLTKKRAIWTPQNEFFQASGLSMVNYGDSGAISSCAKCDDQASLRQGGYTIRWSNLRWLNTTRRMRWTIPFKDIHIDLDGTLTGQPKATTLFDYAHNRWPECRNGGAAFDDGMVCNSSVVVRALTIDGVNPRELDWRLLKVAGPSKTTRSSISMRPKEWYGWVMPVVSQRSYQMAWDSPVDFQSMVIRYSLQPYVTPQEWVRMTFPFIDRRWQFQVNYIQRVVPWLNRLPTPADQHGSGYINQVNKTYTIVVSAFNATLEKGSYRQYEAAITPLQCPPRGCDVPEPVNLGGKVLWSSPTTWKSGKVPVAGENVVIENTMNVILDVVTPVLGDVVIKGALEFEDPSSKAARELHAASVTVWGFLTVGTVAKPYQGSASIVLYGVRTSPTVVVDNSLFLGNKVLVVLGNLTAVGKPVTTTWSSLGATAAKGSTTIALASPVAWAVGDSIVLSPTHYDVAQVETAVIASVSSNGRTVTVTQPLKYDHLVTSVSLGGTKTKTLTGIVGHTTRNIKITSKTASSSDLYGGHVFVGRVASRVGTVYLTHVAFDSCGKTTSEHSALEFFYPGVAPRPAPINVVRGCSFVNNFNYAIVSTAVSGLVIDQNVFTKVYRAAAWLDIGSTLPTVTRNAVFGVVQWVDETLDWVRPIAGLYLEAQPKLLVGNVVTGSADAGITVRPIPCDAKPVSWDNEVHSSLVGLFILAGTGSCVQFGGVTAWKLSHVGIFTSNQPTQLTVRNTFVADAHLGVSLNFFGGDIMSRGQLLDSVIVGTTQPTVCTPASVCRAAVTADTMANGCGSVFGPKFRHVGLVMSQWTARAKTCEVDKGLPVCRPPNTPERLCAMPWEKRHGVPSTQHAELLATNVTFVNFNMTYCGLRSVAVAHNPSQLDYTPPIIFKQSKWVNVAEDSKFLLGVHETTDSECTKACDGLHLTWIEDKDGGILGKPGTLLPTNPSVGYPTPVCVPKTAWDAQFCASKTTRAVIVENRDPDRGSRRVGPIRSTRVDLVHGNRTSFSVGPFNDLCAKQFHFGQFPLHMWPGEYYLLEATGSLPENLRVSFVSPSDDEAVFVELFVPDPSQVKLFMDGVLVEDSYTLPSLSSPAGTHLRDPQRRRLWFTMRGAPKGFRVFDIQRMPMVQITLHLAATIEEFSGEKVVQNLALLLKIPASRIKIVNVRLGSVIADVQIIDEKPPSVNSTETVAQVARLAQIAQAVVQLASNGTLAVGYPIIDVAVVPPTTTARNATEAASSKLVIKPPNAVPAHEPSPPTTNTTVAQDDSNIILIIVIVGVVAGVALFAAIAAWVMQSARSRRRLNKVGAAPTPLTIPQTQPSQSSALSPPTVTVVSGNLSTSMGDRHATSRQLPPLKLTQAQQQALAKNYGAVQKV